MILLVTSSLSFYSITPQCEFSNSKTQFCQGRNNLCQKITVQEHIFGEFVLVHLTFGLCTFQTDYFTFTYHPFNDPGICAVDNIHRLGFGNIQSQNKITGNPKRTTITTKPPMRIIIRRLEVGENEMKVDVVEERGIGGIVICLFYGPRSLGMRPIPYTTLLTCASLIPRPTRARRIRR